MKVTYISEFKRLEKILSEIKEIQKRDDARSIMDQELSSFEENLLEIEAQLEYIVDYEPSDEEIRAYHDGPTMDQMWQQSFKEKQFLKGRR